MFRRWATRTSLVIAAAVAAVALAACDKGDGKTLKPYDPADYPSQTVAPTSAVDSLDAGSDAGFDAGFDAGDGDAIGAPASLSPATADPGGSIETFQVFAPWTQGGTVDVHNTCDGADVAPAVSWTGVPAGTTEIALALVDDTVVNDGEPFVHWAIAGLDPNEIALVEGDLPSGAVQAINFLGNVAYDGPCPPSGDEPHMYRLTAFALGASPGVADSTPAVEFLDAVEKVTLGTADLSATYSR